MRFGDGLPVNLDRTLVRVERCPAGARFKSSIVLVGLLTLFMPGIRESASRERR